jgi:hypothetical protein
LRQIALENLEGLKDSVEQQMEAEEAEKCEEIVSNLEMSDEWRVISL